MFRNYILLPVSHYFKNSKSMLRWPTTCPLSVSLGSVFIIKPRRDIVLTQNRLLHLHNPLNAEKSLVPRDFFENIENKSKETFLDMIRIFENRDIHRRGHVEFIYAALRHMEVFGVHKDLEVYKSLIDVLPKGKFIPTNIFQAEFQHYPKQQQCIIDLLEQMEDNGVMPDPEMESLLINIFGKRGHPVRKYWRMMYWMPKFKNISPWPLPNPVPNDSFELAKMAIQRISSLDLQTKITVYQASELPDSIDDTWIVSAQSPVQKELLDAHPHDVSIFVEGAFRVWLRTASVSYFILRADPRPKPKPPPSDMDGQELMKPPSVHEQEDGTIFAVCATGTSSRDSLLSWIRCLEADGNTALAEIPILFTLKSPLGEVVPISDTGESSEDKNITSGTDKLDS
ncbi:evolutionarily conserved signaling intermediate in Toll pathway, mitochondrial isoform X1 [Periplaneta americana]|uniref:evolutionarily conserved signaling intermediate in Toll pathway, mitochondrial isoform X1 n=1 Tax=Periplaneta americana TaxID=6978 RepID=UPI0037E88AAA